MYDDPKQMEIDNPRLLERYMLAFWYFHTTGGGTQPWLSCNPPAPGESDECTFLEFTRLEDDSVGYTEKPGSIRWMSSADVCAWQGVNCAGGSVVGKLIL
jgi:hypothetical protein